ncbi:MAG: hypothetical protein WD063_08565 [Pirellulales bacterium]
MISDVLSDAVHEIERYERDFPDYYCAVRPEITKVKLAMCELRERLDCPAVELKVSPARVRLRQSKARADQQWFESGRQMGKHWAAEDAQYEDLARLELDCQFPSCIEEIADQLEICSDCLVGDIGSEQQFSESFAQGFVRGALEVFQLAFPEDLILPDIELSDIAYRGAK